MNRAWAARRARQRVRLLVRRIGGARHQRELQARARREGWKL